MGIQWTEGVLGEECVKQSHGKWATQVRVAYTMVLGWARYICACVCACACVCVGALRFDAYQHGSFGHLALGREPPQEWKGRVSWTTTHTHAQPCVIVWRHIAVMAAVAGDGR